MDKGIWVTCHTQWSIHCMCRGLSHNFCFSQAGRHFLFSQTVTREDYVFITLWDIPFSGRWLRTERDCHFFARLVNVSRAKTFPMLLCACSGAELYLCVSRAFCPCQFCLVWREGGGGGKGIWFTWRTLSDLYTWYEYRFEKLFITTKWSEAGGGGDNVQIQVGSPNVQILYETAGLRRLSTTFKTTVQFLLFFQPRTLSRIIVTRMLLRSSKKLTSRLSFLSPELLVLFVPCDQKKRGLWEREWPIVWII